MGPAEKITQLEKHAELAITESANCLDVIPYCAEAISLMRLHPNLQEEFSELLSNMKCPEFIAVCVHALRWNNLNSLIINKYSLAVEQNDWRAEGALRMVVDAISLDWEDARLFYSDYFPSQNP
ncbi:hypothetical protein [Pseudomonas sp. F(2018)]|uniref:hypothetical protein n=1 Tax=Pseudomonas sp. F(2018) TaxID=2502240 RepID=UPI0010F67A15|nr:hypothetical protein [Pseudomonas sp. F(2018)]